MLARQNGFLSTPNTTDREIAGRDLKGESTKLKNTDSQQSKMTLDDLLALYEESIQGLTDYTRAIRKSIFKTFKET